jgi:tripartite-type tricarboxylate transporter receptor subunit TctC
MLKLRMAKFFLGAALLAVTAGFAGAQNYPNKPIRLVVPFDAGGTVDTLARVVTAQITKQSGVRFIIDNRPGANSAIGSEAVARATPDGYTVLNVSPSLVLNALLRKDVPYDLHRDFVPVTNLGIGQGYLLVVRQELPVKSVRELVALAKSRGDKRLTYGTPGVGNALHVASEIFATKAGIPLLHVPYKGSAPALVAIAAGQVDLMMLSPATVFPFVQNGKVRPIAFTGSERSKEFANVPTMQEAGVEDCVIKGTWVGWFVPAGTPKTAIAVLADEVKKAVQSPEVDKALATGGFDADGRSPSEFARFVQAESRRYGEVIRNAKIELK